MTQAEMLAKIKELEAQNAELLVGKRPLVEEGVFNGHMTYNINVPGARPFAIGAAKVRHLYREDVKSAIEALLAKPKPFDAK